MALSGYRRFAFVSVMALALGPAAAAADESGDPAIIGSWLAEDIGGGGVVDRVETEIEISADGRITGSGGCNRITGSAEFGPDKITFGAIAATRMACPQAVMDQETKFLAALEKTRSWQVDPARRKLTLFGEGNETLVVLAAR